MIAESKELNEQDLEEIARLIKEGFTSGILNDGYYTTSWELTTDKY
jgi:hypothetical protein